MKKKILLICFTLILSSIFTVSIIFYNMMKHNYIESILANANSNIQLIHLILAENKYADKYLFKLSQSLSQKTGFRVTFIRTDGIPLADSNDNSILFENFQSLPSFQIAKKNITSHYVKKQPLTTIPEIKIFTKLHFYNKKSTILMLSKKLTFLEEFQKKFFLAILTGIFISSILSVFLSLYFTAWATKPILQLTNAVREISQGNFCPKLLLRSHDELEELAKNFYNMNQKIKILLQDIQNKANNLQNILDNLSEGILLLDIQGNVILMNKFAEFEFEISNSTHNFFSYSNFSFCHKEIQQSLLNKQTFELKKRIGKKIYKLHNHFMEENKQMILVIQNITQLEQNEELRREFVSNASHELKTPLTIISGFIETIKLGHVQEKQQLEHILNIIDLESKRLNKLVNNLLHLSHLEKNVEQTNKKIYRVSLYRTIPQIKNLYQPLLEEKDISLDISIANDFIESHISEEFLHIVLGNLLENAIKYSKIHSNIILSSKIDNRKLYFKIQDFGCGIAKDEQEKIFQRFYRVDPSRNNKIKGNGLGLSIVKKMIENVNGNISVESELQKGTIFLITIPIIEKS